MLWVVYSIPVRGHFTVKRHCTYVGHTHDHTQYMLTNMASSSASTSAKPKRECVGRATGMILEDV